VSVSWPLGLAGLSALTLVIGATAPGRRRRALAADPGSVLVALAGLPSPRPLRRALGALPAHRRTPRALALLGLSRSDLDRARAGAVSLAAAVALLGAAALPDAAPVLVLVLCAAAAAPDALAAALIRRSTRRLVEQLPDGLDLLAVSTRAGMPLDRALAVVAERLGGPLQRELSQLHRALELGTGRRSALRALAERSGAEPVEQLCATLLRADELGAPVSDSLARLARGMRHARSQRAREQAAKAAPKIQLVVALLMVPATLLLVIGLLVIELTRQVNAVIGSG
jgi:tight adherence protein C